MSASSLIVRCLNLTLSAIHCELMTSSAREGLVADGQVPGTLGASLVRTSDSSRHAADAPHAGQTGGHLSGKPT
jgi:hypothetical protein